MIELLRLADSRMAFIGGLAVDTVCLGVLAPFLTNPDFVIGGGAGNIVLLSLALTAPVLALSSAILYHVIPKTFGAEEVARRMLMAAAVLHGGVQLSALLGLICRPESMSTLDYFLTTFVLTALISLVLVPAGWVVRWVKAGHRQHKTAQAVQNGVRFSFR